MFRSNVRLHARLYVNDLFGLALAYEFYSLASHRVPPITVLCRRYKAVLVTAGLVLLGHIYLTEPLKGIPCINMDV